MTRKNTPCQDCEKRHMACHSTCEDCKAFHVERERIYDARKMSRELKYDENARKTAFFNSLRGGRKK